MEFRQQATPSALLGAIRDEALARDESTTGLSACRGFVAIGVNPLGVLLT